MRSHPLVTATQRRLAALARRLKRDRAGMAATEFALLLPLMVIMYFGVVELTQGFSASRKLTYLGRDLADLAAQATSLTNSGGGNNDVNTIFGAASGVFYPFSGAKMTLTGIVFTTGSDGKVHAYTDWSVATNSGTLRPCGELPRTSTAGNSPPAVPDGLFVAGATVVAADVSYNYTPILGSAFMSIGSNGTKLGTGTVTSIPMQHTSYMQPRSVTRVPYTGSTGSCPNVTFP
ncbi:MAG: pilus assembly protein [Methylobacteriaceae bacterium]|nr:pilus assembly protein [Methylobacteriaceae bacterium]